jgi:hypothetical protein
MNKNLRIGHTVLGALLTCGLIACTTSEATPDGTGGSSPSNGGSTVPASGSGGAAGGSGVTTGLGTLCPAAAQVITNFAYTPSDAGSSDLRFGGNGTLSGGGSFYPNSGTYALAQDLTQGSWHLSGTVGDYSGFGLYFDNCDRVDASKYKGISFTISGTAPGGITLTVGTAGDTAAGEWMLRNGKTTAKATDVGRCAPSQNGKPTDTMNQYYTPGCTAPTKNIPVTTTPTPVTVLWADLTGGLPDPTVNPAELTGISWIFQWQEKGTPFAVDIVMDDLAFIP